MELRRATPWGPFRPATPTTSWPARSRSIGQTTPAWPSRFDGHPGRGSSAGNRPRFRSGPAGPAVDSRGIRWRCPACCPRCPRGSAPLPFRNSRGGLAIAAGPSGAWTFRGIACRRYTGAMDGSFPLQRDPDLASPAPDAQKWRQEIADARECNTAGLRCANVSMPKAISGPSFKSG